MFIFDNPFIPVPNEKPGYFSKPETTLINDDSGAVQRASKVLEGLNRINSKILYTNIRGELHPYRIRHLYELVDRFNGLTERYIVYEDLWVPALDRKWQTTKVKKKKRFSFEN
ncbi:Oidioi.mRNA.OKI2018_I69.chr1.g2756.t1.cds [Oikopleura dioica]|uniref:Oidioi.mRNA.OKI2018_I69.chr1.g2756.t1.cds n=1 Tax=Oikopleura dioica TaxID=34765 RepID=A0ABN7SS02_OIKDI|nr:Oidioi.mRNA.OKI2018_I69.chr1.g2756.t1.cds [Oikopleura dioica]